MLPPASPLSIASPEIGALPTSLQLSGGSATNLVHGAIAAAHASISGEPQLLPTISSPASSAAPAQLFPSTSLPINSRASAKLKAKIWNKEFVEFDSLLSKYPGHDKC